MAVGLPGNDRSLNARQKLLRFGQGQSQVRNIAKTFRPADLYQIGAQATGIIPRRNQPQHPSHPRSPGRLSTRPIVRPVSSYPHSLDTPPRQHDRYVDHKQNHFRTHRSTGRVELRTSDDRAPGSRHRCGSAVCHDRPSGRVLGHLRSRGAWPRRRDPRSETGPLRVRPLALAEANGALQMSTDNAVWRRTDGPQPRWERVYSVEDPEGGTTLSTVGGIRGMTAVPNPSGPGDLAVVRLGARPAIALMHGAPGSAGLGRLRPGARNLPGHAGDQKVGGPGTQRARGERATSL